MNFNITKSERGWEVVDAAGRTTGQLTWDEMLGQVAMMTFPLERAVAHGGRLYPMKTAEDWAAERAARIHATTKEPS